MAWGRVGLTYPNLYVYVGGDPLNATDPSGQSLVGEIGVMGIQSGLMSMLIGAPFRVYQAAKELNQGLSAGQIILNLAEREAFDFGVGFALGGFGKILANTFRYVGSTLNVSFSIFNKLSSAGPLYEGTQLPKYFALATDEGSVFVKQNATKHLFEVLTTGVNDMLKGVSAPSLSGYAGLTRSASALILESLQSAVNAAMKLPGGAPTARRIVVEGWELVFQPQAQGIKLALVHAVPVSI